MTRGVKFSQNGGDIIYGWYDMKMVFLHFFFQKYWWKMKKSACSPILHIFLYCTLKYNTKTHKINYLSLCRSSVWHLANKLDGVNGDNGHVILYCSTMYVSVPTFSLFTVTTARLHQDLCVIEMKFKILPIIEGKKIV